MFPKPFVHVETEILLAPKHTGQGLAHDQGLIVADSFGSDVSIELVRLTLASLHDFSKAVEGIAHRRGCLVREPQADRGRLTGANKNSVVRRRFCSHLLRVDGLLLAV